MRINTVKYDIYGLHTIVDVDWKEIIQERIRSDHRGQDCKKTKG